MNTLLVGNGINIQFGGRENLNKEIILRAIRNTKSEDFPKDIIVDDPELLLSLLGYLFLEVRQILAHKYDQFAFSSDEKAALGDFINRYDKRESLSIADIGFEDYYLIYDLFCYKNRIVNPEKYYIREALKVFFLHAIYNQGRVNEIYRHFPCSLKRLFRSFDSIFTTNYDKNIETFAEVPVYYLHGAFHIRADVYNTDSLRNKLNDSPMRDYKVDEEHFYLYSNALTTYSGNSKLFSIKQGMHANEAIRKLAVAYQEDPDVKKSVDEWEKDTNELVRKLAEAAKIKCVDPDLQFSEAYPIKEFEAIEGSLSIIGLSPNNDTHIFTMVNENSKIESIEYFYHSEAEIDQIKTLILKHPIKYSDVHLLWEKYRC